MGRLSELSVRVSVGSDSDMTASAGAAAAVAAAVAPGPWAAASSDVSVRKAMIPASRWRTRSGIVSGQRTITDPVAVADEIRNRALTALDIAAGHDVVTETLRELGRCQTRPRRLQGRSEVVEHM